MTKQEIPAPPMVPPNWLFKATVRRIVDGDTVDLEVDLGFTVHADIRFRLLGIDAPELRRGTEREREDGRLAAHFLEELIPVGSVCWVMSRKTGKYGRWLGAIWKHLDDGTSINEQLVDAGHADWSD